MKTIFLTLFTFVCFGLQAYAGRESHGFAPSFRISCVNENVTTTKVYFNLLTKPVQAKLSLENQEIIEFECKGVRVLNCLSSKSNLAIQLLRKKNQTTASIFENRRVVETIPCL